MSMRVSVRVMRTGPVASELPSYRSEDAAGLDLCAAIADPIELLPGERRLIPSGLCFEIPPGFEGQVRPRSGLALRYGIGMVNAPGTIDADYRGEVGVLLVNHGDAPFRIEPGARIAQLVICPVARAELTLVSELGASARGSGGFGSTGV